MLFSASQMIKYAPRLTAIVLLLTVAHAHARAQRPLIEVGVGGVVPTGFKPGYFPGPLLRLGVESRSAGKAEVRLDAEYSQVPRHSEGTLSRSFALVANILVRGRNPGTQPYGLISPVLNVFLYSASDDCCPGVVPGLRGGFGVARQVGRARLSFEIAPTFAWLGGGLRLGPIPISLGTAF